MRIRNYLFVLAVCLFTSGTAWAGLKAAITFENSTVVKYETVRCYIVLHNDTDDIFSINKKNNYNDTDIFLRVEKKGKKKVTQIKKGAMLSRLSMYPNDMRTIMINLSEWFNLAEPGKYIVTPVIQWNGKTYEAEKSAFEVVSGIELASVTKNLPGYRDRTRVYSLRYWTRQSAEHLFLTVSDEESGENWTFLLGQLIRVFHPDLNVNNRGLVTVVHQATKDCFVRTSFESSTEGIFFINQTYHLPSGAKYPSARLKNELGVKSDTPKVNND